MSTSRRHFLQITGAAGAALGLGGLASAESPAANVEKAAAPLKILVLGGTQLIGPPLVEYATKRGHTVTLFNRGKTNTHLFPELEKLKGDRNDDLKSLEGRKWDVVIDNSASIPRWVRQSAGLLKDSASRYLFTSSISVFGDFKKIGINEDDPVAQLEDPSTETITGETYGGMKALCEEETRKAFGDKAVIVRPGLIVGPMDPTDRFTYWPVRIADGGNILAPGEPADPVQIIDARDLAEWYVRIAEEGIAGTFNATGPSSTLSIAEMLYGIRAVTSRKMSFTWVDADFLAAQEVQPWAHMTCWVPPTDGYEGFGLIDCSRAIDAGLTFRPLAETARDTLTWWNSLPEERRATLRAGLPREKEKEVLAAWKKRNEKPAEVDETS